MYQGFNYSKLIGTLINAINEFSGRDLIESSSAGEPPEYPYCQYTITSPYLSITSDVVEGEVFETVVSLTWRSLSGQEVLNLAGQTNKFFRSQAGRLFMQENGNHVVVDVTNTGMRDTFISIEYERMAGVDLRLRVQDEFMDPIDRIENIEISNTNLGG